MNKWHKPDDYPQPYKDVLLCDIKGKMIVGFYCKVYKNYASKETYEDIVPIAWMELPRPYNNKL